MWVLALLSTQEREREDNSMISKQSISTLFNKGGHEIVELNWIMRQFLWDLLRLRLLCKSKWVLEALAAGRKQVLLIRGRVRKSEAFITHLTLQISNITRQRAGSLFWILFITDQADMEVSGEDWVGESLGTRNGDLCTSKPWPAKYSTPAGRMSNDAWKLLKLFWGV